VLIIASLKLKMYEKWELDNKLQGLLSKEKQLKVILKKSK